MSRGVVYLVGAGPGDPGLVTWKGLEILRAADVVVYDRLVGSTLLAQARSDAEMVDVGKKPGDRALSQEGINDLLVAKARAGLSVCRLKGGDPFVFGRGGEEALALLRANIPFVVVAGVTSALAVPAYAGIPVTHRGMVRSFAVVTGHRCDEGQAAGGGEFDGGFPCADTLVFLMGVSNLKAIVGRLLETGWAGGTPAALVGWGTTSRQATLVGTLADIVEKASDMQPPAVLVVGPTVGLRDSLSWFERLPLFGKRVLVTRAREQASGPGRGTSGAPQHRHLAAGKHGGTGWGFAATARVRLAGLHERQRGAGGLGPAGCPGAGRQGLCWHPVGRHRFGDGGGDARAGAAG